jgi:protein-S-isoprenylcysteine O-methyltransferase Ste14
MIRMVAALLAAAIYLALAVFAYGGVAAFFAEPAFVAVTAIFAILTVAAVFAGGNPSSGVREDRGNRWVIFAVIVVGLASAIIPPWNDRAGFWTIDGETTRWIGVALLSIGGVLRIAPVFVLGHRFSGLVAIQRDHRLVTGGLYGVIRHPSYLGLLLGALGWVLAFRSAVGVLLTLLLIPVLVARIRAEEALLESHFGEEYAVYRARTWRLIPGVY